MSNCQLDVSMFLITVFILLNPNHSCQSIRNSNPNITQQIEKCLPKELTVLYGLCYGVTSSFLCVSGRSYVSEYQIPGVWQGFNCLLLIGYLCSLQIPSERKLTDS